MTKHKTNYLKALALSIGLAALMPAVNNLNAQNPSASPAAGQGGGLFGRGIDSGNEWYGGRGAMNIPGNSEEGISNYGIGEPDGTPLGSGIAILIGAGLGYVALKRKEDKQ